MLEEIFESWIDIFSQNSECPATTTIDVNQFILDTKREETIKN